MSWRQLGARPSAGLMLTRQYLCCHTSDATWHVTGINTLMPRKIDDTFPTTLFKRIFLNENWCIFDKDFFEIFPKDPINDISPLVRIMAWCRSGNKPLSEPTVTNDGICVIRPQWVTQNFTDDIFKKAFSWMKIVLFWYEFHWNLFFRERSATRWSHCFCWGHFLTVITRYGASFASIDKKRICIRNSIHIKVWYVIFLSYPNFRAV